MYVRMYNYIFVTYEYSTYIHGYIYVCILNSFEETECHTVNVWILLSANLLKVKRGIIWDYWSTKGVPCYKKSYLDLLI